MYVSVVLGNVRLALEALFKQGKHSKSHVNLLHLHFTGCRCTYISIGLFKHEEARKKHTVREGKKFIFTHIKKGQYRSRFPGS